MTLILFVTYVIKTYSTSIFIFATWFFLSLTLLNAFDFLIWYISIISLALLIAISIIVCELFKALQTMNEK